MRGSFRSEPMQTSSNTEQGDTRGTLGKPSRWELKLEKQLFLSVLVQQLRNQKFRKAQDKLI